MKIVHVAECFATGTYDFLSDLTLGMPEFTHVVVHGVRPDTPAEFRKDFPPDVQFHQWCHARREIDPFGDLRALLSLLRILKSLTPFDVLHLHSSKAGFLGRVAARILGVQKRTVFTTHAASFLRKDISQKKTRFFIMLERAAAKIGGTVVACSNSERGEFAKNGIPAISINNGVRGFDSPATREVSKEIIIGTSGRITIQKNPELFNEIASHFLDKKDVVFRWIGDGEMRGSLTSPNIDITGWIGKASMPHRINEINLYLSTSLWEGLPLSVMQAMSLAKPVVLSDCVGNRDLVEEGINGHLFGTSSEAVRLISDIVSAGKCLEIYGDASKKLIEERFSFSRTIQGYRDLYIRLAGAESAA